MKSLQWLMRAGLILGLGLGIPACNYGNNYYSGPYSIAWYVDPLNGVDVIGNGSPAFPFRTIHFALLQAISGDSIFLAPRNYSAGNGEIFPILLKAGVSLVGDPATNGSTTTIVNGGSYTVSGGLHINSPLTVGVVMGSGASLSGVTISVSGTTGVGVVFDGTTASLTNCTLTGCGASGVQVFQSASPTLASNIITQSGGSGVVTYDNSAPILRQNNISSNLADGILADDTSVPNLGDPFSPGGNTLQLNTTQSLANNTTASAIPAAGNTWNATVQGSDPQGHYSAGAANPALVGTNYSITNSPAASIQF
jgi:parallel beta-helix repeat protein